MLNQIFFSCIRTVLILSLVIVGFACGHKHDPLLEEAAAIHMEAVEMEATIKDRINQLIQQRNSLAIQGRELTEAEFAFAGQVDRVESTYTWWQENHVEVPGYGHDGHHHHGHDHDHDHDHDHGPALEVTPEDMLLIQKEFRDSILALQELVNTMSLPEVPADLPVE